MRKRLPFIASVAALLFAGFGCGNAPAAPTSANLTIMASFYPLAHFASKVAGDLASVTNVTPAGAEPHDYEPTPRQVAAAHEADLFVYNGGGMDNWAARLAPSLDGSRTATLEISPAVDAKLPAPEGEQELAFDPHFWLDPVIAQKEVEAIRDKLIAIDAAHAETYRANAAAYVAELAQLDAEFKGGLASCRLHTAVTSHAAFAYLGARYGFTQLSIAGLSPEEEPSAGAMASLAAAAKAKDVHYVFFETLVNPQLSKTIAAEIGAQTLVFNPLEGLTDGDIAAGRDYLSVQRENLANLRTALECQ
ncbi:MAG TPA: zinc ABC transporter substrate-binding protein [Candidatus Binatia bacterium]|nr:zinc ABC transporter substrate-binding protein [Candidatus Binatia bacterium]